jgi:hypothetical protein
MNEERVPLRVDLRDAGVMTLEVQIGGRNGAVEILQWGPGDDPSAWKPLRLFEGRTHSERARWSAGHASRI